LLALAVVESEDDDDVAEENERWEEDEDASPLYLVVPESAISSSRLAYEDEYVNVLFVGLVLSNVTTSKGILLGLALTRKKSKLSGVSVMI
jgi:hypothetical protein